MFDLHTHSIFSDGELLPSEMARRMACRGNRGFAITDHADFSNISLVLSNLRRLELDVEFLIGVEITHVPPRLIGKACRLAWDEGAEIVIVHGETLAEPVAEGTNSAALDEDINILAHPGLITEEEAEKAKERDIFLEISAKRGHCLSNGHVAMVANAVGCGLVIDTDAHAPSDIIDDVLASRILLGAGIEDWKRVMENNEILFRRLKK
jgi:histidinol phosphatase-like PHP family hydrolase